MKTIEQYETEILQKNAIINEMMESFSLNIDRFNQVLGKDPQYVYGTLDAQWKKTISEYQTTTLRNQDILQRWSDKLDAIISVLNEVALILKDLDALAFAKNEQSSVVTESSGQMTNVQDLEEKVSEQLDNLTNIVQDKIENAGAREVKSAFVKGAITGGLTYVALSIIGVRPAIKVAASCAAAYFLAKKSE